MEATLVISGECAVPCVCVGRDCALPYYKAAQAYTGRSESLWASERLYVTASERAYSVKVCAVLHRYSSNPVFRRFMYFKLL